MRKFKLTFSSVREMMGWYLKLAATLILAILSFIGLGIIDMRGLEARIKTVEDRTEILTGDMGRFQSTVKEDIGIIKGQNNIIIKLLNKNGDIK